MNCYNFSELYFEYNNVFNALLILNSLPFFLRQTSDIPFLIQISEHYYSIVLCLTGPYLRDD